MASTGEIAPGTVRVVEIDGRSLCVGLTEDGEWGAIDNVCTPRRRSPRRRRARRERRRMPSTRRSLRPLLGARARAPAGRASTGLRDAGSGRRSPGGDRRMKVSTRTEYGIRLLIQLARQDGGGPVSLAGIARREKLPHPYLEQLVGQLRRAGLVSATRGQAGGYQLARPAELISMAEAVRHPGGPVARDAVRRRRQPRGLRSAPDVQRARALPAGPRIARPGARIYDPRRGRPPRPAALPIHRRFASGGSPSTPRGRL